MGDVLCKDANSDILKQSLLKMMYSEPGGIPEYLYIDNGKDYTAKTMTGRDRNDRSGMDFDDTTKGFYKSIGIKDDHRALPYEPWSKGQIERFFRTVCNRFTKWFKSYTGTLTGSKTSDKVTKDIKRMCENGELLTMEEFYEEWHKWLTEVYMHTEHGGLKKAKETHKTPYDCFMNEEEYRLLDDESRAKAFTVSGYTSLQMLQEFLDCLTKAAEEGTTKEQFLKDMNSFLEEHGYEGMNPWKSDNIFRTNMQTAFNAGHYKSMTDETTKKMRPYWQYKTAGDGHVRETHQAMAERVFPADDPIWDVWYPPNGFRCRCMVVSLTRAQVERRGLTVEHEIPYDVDYSTGEIIPAFPDKGFSNNPAKAAWKSLKEAVKARGYVTVCRAEYDNAVQVTKGHCFKTEPDASGNELKFYAVEDTVIDAGAQTGKVLVEAEEPGTYYNVAPGKITISMIHIDGMDYVTNEKEWLIREGADVEDYEDLRSRCTSSWAELATRTIEEKLRNAARSVPGVLDARVDAQHPRGQGTVDIIITSSAGEASPELTAKVEEAVEPLKGQYADYLVRSSEVVVQDINVIIYLAQYASTDGVKEKAQNIITNVMKLPRDEMNTLYKDSIISALCEIENYRKTVFKAPTEDMELSGDKVIMAGNITVEVKNVKGE